MWEPTIAEERIARKIAFWHGAKIVARRDGETLTVAAQHGFGGWGHSPERYADAHWREYVHAARAVMDLR